LGHITELIQGRGDTGARLNISANLIALGVHETGLHSTPAKHLKQRGDPFGAQLGRGHLCVDP
jgi:hypothetical protein